MLCYVMQLSKNFKKHLYEGFFSVYAASAFSSCLLHRCHVYCCQNLLTLSCLLVDILLNLEANVKDT